MAYCHGLPSVANPLGALRLQRGLCGWVLALLPEKGGGGKGDVGDFDLLPSAR